MGKKPQILRKFIEENISPSRQNCNNTKCHEKSKKVRIDKHNYTQTNKQKSSQVAVCFACYKVTNTILSFYNCRYYESMGWLRMEIWKQFVRELCNCIHPSLLNFCRKEEDLMALIVWLSWKKNFFFYWFCSDGTLEVLAKVPLAFHKNCRMTCCLLFERLW